MCGIGSRTDFSHIFEMFDDANMRSGLYPFFYISLLNDYGSFALCMSDRLFDSSHSSTASFFCFFRRRFIEISKILYRVVENKGIREYNMIETKAGARINIDC